MINFMRIALLLGAALCTDAVTGQKVPCCAYTYIRISCIHIVGVFVLRRAPAGVATGIVKQAKCSL